MITQKNGYIKMNSLANAILKLTDEDFEYVRNFAHQQQSYTHPLKMGKAAKLHRLGNHNEQVCEKLQELKTIIEAFKK